MQKKILVPIDDSKNSHRALTFALNLAEELEAKLILLNVQPNINTMNVKRFFSDNEITSYSLSVGKEILEKSDALTAETNVPIEKIVQIGTPKVEITTLADDIDAYCIVIGSRGHGPIKGAMLGSVSYGVLHEATCPVTVIP